MKVRIHRGAAEIGGSCVELECAGKRLVLDVGRPLWADTDEHVPLPPVAGLSFEVEAAGISIDGSSGAENKVYLDGIDTTSAQKGIPAKEIPADFVSEVQVKTSGYPAEFGGSTGGVINVLTRSGGDRLPSNYRNQPLRRNPRGSGCASSSDLRVRREILDRVAAIQQRRIVNRADFARASNYAFETFIRGFWNLRHGVVLLL